MSALISGLVGGAVATVCVLLADRSQKKANQNQSGWKSLRPSWLLHGTFVGCIAFVALIIAFFLNGGSSRADAATQNLYAMALLLAFGLGATYCGWMAYGRVIEWNDSQLRQRNIFGREIVKEISDSSLVKARDFRGDYRIAFTDGSTVVFLQIMHGAKELLSELRQANPPYPSLLAAYSQIEEVSAQPENINSGSDGWGFTMWSEFLDDEAPHRMVLERFAAAHPEAGIILPEYDRYEDFVEAKAAWNGQTVSIYYETILSYVWLWSPNREAVQSFRAALLPTLS